MQSEKNLFLIKLKDKLASVIISVSGVIIILCLIGIIAVIFSVAYPLFLSSSHSAPITYKFAETSETAVKTLGTTDPDKYIRITVDGVAVLYDISADKKLKEIPLLEPDEGQIKHIDSYESGVVSIMTHLNTFKTYKLTYTKDYVEESKFTYTADPVHETLRPDVVRFENPRYAVARSDGEISFYAETDGNELSVVHASSVQDLSGETTTSVAVSTPMREEISGAVSAIAGSVSGAFKYFVLGTKEGFIEIYTYNADLKSFVLSGTFQSGKSEIKNIGILFGSNTIVVTDSEGIIHFWNITKDLSDPSGYRILKIRDPLEIGFIPTGIYTPMNGKNYVLQTAERINIRNMTSGRDLLTVNGQGISSVISDRRFSRIALIKDDGSAEFYDIHLTYPDFSLSVLFSKVHYENYSQPEYIWQSSSGSDDFEPKYSFAPLIFGSLKGTLWSMLFAVPLALVGGVYTAMFMKRELKRYVKPMIEIMAALPSVIIGFLAALWIAPAIRMWLSPLFVFMVVFPAVICLTYFLLIASKKRLLSGRWIRGYEFLWVFPAFLISVVISVAVGTYIEQNGMNGDITAWLLQTLGINYDQRNSIVIAFALGFTMIPIIFTITEDSVSNVPNTLIASSLALGANMWQTTIRVVIPSAAPGIFAALIIGFGRAIGETMIVLMATGNTPIMDFSIFSGMRTLSANIAVEIPEAPHGETLYRVLFLSAILLFAITFILNMIAEYVRQRLRRKYSYS